MTPSRWLAPWHIAGPWTAWSSVPSPLWLDHCGSDVNGELYLSLSQTCTNRIIVFLFALTLTIASVLKLCLFDVSDFPNSGLGKAMSFADRGMTSRFGGTAIAARHLCRMLSFLCGICLALLRFRCSRVNSRAATWLHA